MSTDVPTTYSFDNAAEGERQRLAAVEATYDPTTKDHLVRLGLREGSSVLFVGAGGGSLVGWACGHVGSTGSVVATDMDPRFLLPLADRFENLEVRQHDIAADDLAEQSVEFAHARLVLGHLTEYERAIEKLVSALKPGGWLLAEEFDWGSYGPAYPNEAGEATIQAVRKLMVGAGFQPHLGRRLPTIFRRLGLDEVDAAGRVLTLRGATSRIEPIYRQGFAQLKDKILGANLMTPEEAEAFEERFEDPEYDLLGHTMMSVWGRRPL